MLGAHCSLWKMIQTTESFFFRQGSIRDPAAAGVYMTEFPVCCSTTSLNEM